MKNFTVFSLSDIRMIDEDFYRRRLSEWQDKGYIKKIINKYYAFTDIELTEDVLFEIANRIYNPSYISLRMALSYYHLIPESVYTITSISTRRTYAFNTDTGTFSYRTVKPELFFGFKIVRYNSGAYKIASIEKSMLDYFYLNPDIQSKQDFTSLRINRDVFQEKMNIKKMNQYLKRFNQIRLKNRVQFLLEYIDNA